MVGVKGLADLISGGFDSLCVRSDSMSASNVRCDLCKLSVTQRKTLEGENANSLDLM